MKNALAEVKEFQKRDRAKHKAGTLPKQIEYAMCLNTTRRGMIVVAGADELEASRRALEILGYFLRKIKKGGRI